MDGVGIQRVAVWSGWVRVAHWSLALSVLVLLLSGWLLAAVVPPLQATVRDYHYSAGYFFLGALTLRLALLFFGRGAAHWRDCIPQRTQLRAARNTLRCYLSLGRTPLPQWYAHNPLWGPVYLVWLAAFVVQGLSGLFIDAPYRVAGISLPVLHQWLAQPLGVVTALHIVAVFVHDLKGPGAHVSAMINGHRFFELQKPEGLAPFVQERPVTVVRAPRSGQDGGSAPG